MSNLEKLKELDAVKISKAITSATGGRYLFALRQAGYSAQPNSSNKGILLCLAEALQSAQRRITELEERLGLVREQRDAELARNTALEAELARRDAAAGEPLLKCSNRTYATAPKNNETVSFELRDGESEYDRLHRMYKWMKYKSEPAAQPAALPEPWEVFRQAGGVDVAVRNGVTKNHLSGIGYNQAIADAKALGLKPIKLAKDLKVKDGSHQSHIDYAEGYNDRAELDRQAIREAGFTVEGDSDE